MERLSYWKQHNLRNFIRKNPSFSIGIEDIELIDRWLQSEQASRHNKRIQRLSVPDALKLSRNWFKKLKEKGEVIRTYENNIQWLELTNDVAIQNEGYRMDNCLKKNKLTTRLFSLRDNGTSVVNFEINNNIVSQVKGFKNFEVPEKYRRYVLDLVVDNPLMAHHLSTDVLIDLGCMYLNNFTYSLTNLPKNMKISHSVNFIKNNLITEIPDNWNIKGNLILKQCPNLKKIGRNIQVSGYICIEDCPNFQGFEDEMLSVRSIELKHLDNLIKLPINLNTIELIEISDCKRLSQLPLDMYSAKDLKLNNLGNVTKINKIQANEIKIENCQNLLNIDSCMTSTNLTIVNNEKLERLPSQLYIGKYLRSDRVVNPKEKFNEYEHIYVGKGLLIKENDEWFQFLNTGKDNIPVEASPIKSLIKSFLPFMSLSNPKKVEFKEKHGQQDRKVERK